MAEGGVVTIVHAPLRFTRLCERAWRTLVYTGSGKRGSLRAGLVYNPTAGQVWNPFHAQEAKAILEEMGWQVDLFPTEGPGGGTVAAQQAMSAGAQVVIAAGGDGTINEVVQAVAKTEVHMALLPVGTTNVLARDLRLPLNWQQCCRLLPDLVPYPIDLGRVNERYYILMAGFGLDAAISMDTHRTWKRWTGMFAFAVASLRHVFSTRPYRLHMEIVDEKGRRKILRRRAHQVVVSNASTYASGWVVAPEARFNDGILEVLIFKARRVWEILYPLAVLILHQRRESRHIEHQRVVSIQIRANRKMPIQVDGETIGETPATVTVHPQALHLLVPVEFGDA